MILYLDTSALIKAYVTEEGTTEVLAAIRRVDAVASHLIAFVEANAAFSRLSRENVLTEKQCHAVRSEFLNDWGNYVQVGLNQSILQRAADLAGGFALRAYDSVHLAAADLLLKQGGDGVLFACFDRRLNQAAKVLGLPLIADRQ